MNRATVQIRHVAGHPGAIAATEPAWEGLESRVAAYLHACGVRDEPQAQGLARQVMERLAARMLGQAGEQPARLAIQEAQALIDERLAAALGPERPPDPRELALTRAAVLGGRAAPWPAVIMGSARPSAEVGRILREAWAQPVPPESAVPMEPQPIRFYSASPRALYRLGKRVLRRLFAPFLGRR